MNKDKSSSSKPTIVVPFHIPQHMESASEQAISFQTISTLLTMVALVLKNRWAGWLSIFAAIASLTNDKALTSSSDSRASWTTVLFSLMGLLLQYLPRILIPSST